MPPLDQKDANRGGGRKKKQQNVTTIPFEFQKEERNATMASVISQEQPPRLSLHIVGNLANWSRYRQSCMVRAASEQLIVRSQHKWQNKKKVRVHKTLGLFSSWDKYRLVVTFPLRSHPHAPLFNIPAMRRCSCQLYFNKQD